MTDIEVRPVAEGEQRAVLGVLKAALHSKPPSDEEWELAGRSFPADRKFAVFAEGRPVGLTSSFATEIAVPGGALVSLAAVDGVGVRADHTRRGIMTALLSEQLRDCARRGEVFAALHASESTIYGRFGYGVATRGKTVRVSGARFRPEAPTGGRVRLLEPEVAVKEIPALYQRIAPSRPGMIARPEVWWPSYHDRLLAPRGDYLVAVHTGPGGDDGFAMYQPVDLRTFETPNRGTALEVRDLQAANPVARAGLWRFLVGVDLVSEVRAPMRPVDEPIGAMLVDPRACEVVGLADHTWLRVLDVPAALAARSYRSADPIVLEVIDEALPANSGRYRIGVDGVGRTDEPGQLKVTAEVLAMIYLGEWAPSVLAEVGRVEVADPAALEPADELFRTTVRPWCGTYF
ncbi:GNAT family N-acetyltransferase [Amycolatopsis anabasis]|uniref:GNAT family N-acetyltransferase n=1 Tax=Amycolatopsis anabasis TaxID=1840409 RepID=UPI00131DFBF6|nr:GNAT family N-acetyltransferase [Amycolatopsis anabasis]